MGKGIRFLLAVSVVMLGFVVAPKVQAEVYDIDKSHSTVGFTTKHLMVSKVSGQFGDYEGVIDYDPNNLDASKINVTIKVDSINTSNEKRDEHLKQGDFFDTAKFPDITFVSKTITKDAITGDLTIKGVTKEVTLASEIAGPVNSPFGGSAIGINATGKINRQDYGVTWNKTMDNGGLMVSDDVEINVSIEAHKK